MRNTIVFGLSTFLLAPGYAAHSAEVKGVVVSYTTQKPLKGVTVSVNPAVPGRDPVYTGADGRYDLDGLPVGQYTLEFDLVSYRERPERREIKIAMNTDKLACNVILKPEDIGGWAAAQLAAEAFRHQVEGGEKAVYVHRWQLLRNGTLSVEEKLAFATALSEDPKAKDYLPLQEYLNAPKNGDQLREFSNQLRETLAGGKSLPNTEAIQNLGPDLAADIVLFQLRTADVDAKRKLQVADEITTKWKGLAPSRVVEAHFLNSQRNATRPP